MWDTIGDTLMEIWMWIWNNLVFINLIFSIIIVFFQRRDPKAVWTWLLVLYFIPIVGFILYLVICQDMYKSHMFKVKEVEDGLNSTISMQEEVLKTKAHDKDDFIYSEFADLALYNLEVEGAILTDTNELEIFTDGVKKFNDLISEMKNATDYIHMQYYIIRNDELFDEIRKVLIEKARQGVEVRILYDAMGCRMFPGKLLKELRAAGIEITAFFPASLKWFHLRLNYRNHRKIVVIDGKVAYVGGFNVGREYISKDPKFGYWRDTHLKVWGDAVMALQMRFALDWNFATRKNLFTDSRYFTYNGERKGCRRMQIIASGPDAKTENIRDTYLRMMHKAKKNIYIQTPYFIPDESILTALTIAAKSGVDVRLMIPCKPDHPFVYWATYSYLGDLLEAGARCFTYQNGFIHAKGVMVDGAVSSYGTANMDIRSFQLNFEVNAVIYDEEATGMLEEIFLEDIKNCKEITAKIYAGRPLIIRLKEQVCRLLSPLM